MKLLLVSPKTEDGKGGIAVWTDTFLNNSENAGLDCDLLNTALQRARKNERKRNFLDEFKRTRRIFRNLKKMLKNGAYEVAHVNTSCGTFGMVRDYFIARKIKRKQPACKVVLQFHCDVKTQSASKLTQIFLKRALKLVDKILVLNEKNVCFLRQAYHTESISVPNFVDENVIRREQKTIRETIENALFAGFVQAQKGVWELYELAKRFPFITFSLYGNVREEFQTAPHPANVVLCGPKSHEEVLAALDEADVFVFPTHSEGFSVALLECMARGVPSVTTDVGANLEMLENKGGIVVPVKDVDALEQAMKNIADASLRREMSEWSIQKTKNTYTAEAVLEKIQSVYSDN